VSLNLDKDEFILIEDLLVTLESYGNDPNIIGNANIHKHISSYPDLSPRSRYENIISLLTKSLKQQNMVPMNVYKMADTKNSGKVSFRQIKDIFIKLVKNISGEIVLEGLKAFGGKINNLDN
jgi:hypothetical protein